MVNKYYIDGTKLYTLGNQIPSLDDLKLFYCAATFDFDIPRRQFWFDCIMQTEIELAAQGHTITFTV